MLAGGALESKTFFNLHNQAVLDCEENYESSGYNKKNWLCPLPPTHSRFFDVPQSHSDQQRASPPTQGSAGASPALSPPLVRPLREIALIVCGLLTIYLLLSLLSYDAADPSWSYSGPAGEIANSGGIVGAWCANFLLHFFGVVAYAFPLIIGYSGWALYRYEAPDDSSTVADYALLIRLCGVCLAIIAGCGMATLYLELARPLLKGIGAGGMVGELIAAQLRVMLGDVGATLVFLGMF